ncbi:hypothetical protein B0H16DRAFT_1583790 [Mycena metata]|uniref:Uncharacterized protein n=1 Tax=Mycena metata TaxID=1033252 RepID=A0AAD7HZ65_9AGAR|nr:hypothetical protein B0H16DRAFT_1583790 [Mycena metata]
MSTTTTTTVTLLAIAREEAREHVANALPDEQSKINAGNTLLENLHATVKKQADENARSLARTISNIRTGFMTVAGTLVLFDANHYEDTDGNVLSLGSEGELLFTINLDVHSLHQALSGQLENNQSITKLNVAQEIYGHLTYLLETYIKQVNELNTQEAKKSVAQIIRNIRTGFIIADTLIPHQDSNVLLLREEWTRLIKEFEKTLQFSFEQATDAVYLMKTVQTVLGDVAEADGKDLAVELREFIKQLGPKDADVPNMKTTFEKLAEDVLLFRASIYVVLAKEDDKSMPGDGSPV